MSTEDNVPEWLRGPSSGGRKVRSEYDAEAFKDWLVSQAGFKPYRAQDYARRVERLVAKAGFGDVSSGAAERGHPAFEGLTPEAERKMVEAARLASRWASGRPPKASTVVEAASWSSTDVYDGKGVFRGSAHKKDLGTGKGPKL